MNDNNIEQKYAVILEKKWATKNKIAWSRASPPFQPLKRRRRNYLKSRSRQLSTFLPSLSGLSWLAAFLTAEEKGRKNPPPSLSGSSPHASFCQHNSLIWAKQGHARPGRRGCFPLGWGGEIEEEKDGRGTKRNFQEKKCLWHTHVGSVFARNSGRKIRHSKLPGETR